MRGRGALLGLFAVLALLLRTPESAAQPFDPARPLGLRPPLGASIRPANAVPPPSRKRLSEVAKFRAAHPHFKPERRDLTQIAEDAGVWDSIDDQTDGLETMVNLDSSDAVLERPNVAESRRRRRRQLVPRLACVPNLAFKNKTLCDTIYAGASYADMGSANGRHAFIVSDGKPRIILAGRIAPRWQLTMPTNLNGMSGCTTYATRMTALGDIILSCNNRQWANITVRNNGKYPRSMTIDNYGSVRFYSFNGALLLTITPGLQPSPIGALTLKTLAVTSSKTRTTSRTKTRTATRTTTRFTTSMTRSTSSSETSSMTADETSTSLTIPDPTSSTTETTSSETATRSSSTSATRTATRTRTTTTSATRTTTATTTQTSSTSRTKTTTYTVIQSLVPRYPVQKEVGSYFTSWGIYERGFFPKVATSSSICADSIYDLTFDSLVDPLDEERLATHFSQLRVRQHLPPQRRLRMRRRRSRRRWR